VTWLLVALGAAVGAPLRYLSGHVIDGGFPRGTVLVNWVGSFLLGWFTGLGLAGEQMALLGTGFCGGLTTYSSFAVQTHDLGGRGGALNALATGAPALLRGSLGFVRGA
jgi:CrcB protein